MRGGVVYVQHLNDKKMLREADVKIYGAEILLAVEHLHSIGVVHRFVERLDASLNNVPSRNSWLCWYPAR